MRRLVTPLLVAVAIAVPAAAEQHAQAFTLPQVLGFTFPVEMVASAQGDRIAWIMMQRGVRNVWIARAPDFTPRMMTSSREDDGQELTNLSFSADGRYVVWTRGGDHGSNWPAEGNLQPDPTSSPTQPKIEIWSAAVDGTPRMIAEGDAPAPSPTGDIVAFEKGREIWSVPIDGSKPAVRLFFARGENASLEWSPDGRKLAFVTDRESHSFIAIYTSESEPIRYLAPSTSLDSMPVWSPDGTRIAFVRRPGRGGALRPPLEPQPQPWAIWVAEVTTGQAREVWKSDSTLRGSYPRTEGGANLRWVARDRLAFISYQDGWPHLYSVPASAGPAMLLTPGNFMVEYVTTTPDRKFLVYNANTGRDKDDGERRHVFKVPIDSATPVALTSGTGIEWQPVVTSDGSTLAYFASTAQKGPLPYLQPLAGGAARALNADLTDPTFPAASLVTPEHVTFKAPDGTDVHGQLFRAPGGAARRPAIVFVHGGPPRQMLLGWHYMFYYANAYAVNQYLASRGFVVLSVNYRLGIGYGFEFHQPAHAGGRGASEYQDVLAGAKYLQTRTDVDAAHVGIWGGSYGGYLTALALGRNSDVFAAGVDIHGVHTRLPERRNDRVDMAAAVGDGITQAQLDEALRVAWQSSPDAFVSGWRSPVLFIHGDDDRNVRVDETVELVQRLKAKGDVHFEDIIVPDEIHDFLLFRTWLRVDAATAEFFERLFRPAPATR